MYVYHSKYRNTYGKGVVFSYSILLITFFYMKRVVHFIIIYLMMFFVYYLQPEKDTVIYNFLIKIIHCLQLTVSICMLQTTVCKIFRITYCNYFAC